MIGRVLFASFVLAWCGWASEISAEPPGRSFTKIVDLRLGSGALDIHWGPRQPGAAASKRQDLFVHAGNYIRIWWQDESGFPAKPMEDGMFSGH